MMGRGREGEGKTYSRKRERSKKRQRHITMKEEEGRVKDRGLRRWEVIEVTSHMCTPS